MEIGDLCESSHQSSNILIFIAISSGRFDCIICHFFPLVLYSFLGSLCDILCPVWEVISICIDHRTCPIGGTANTWMRSRRISKRGLASLVGIGQVVWFRPHPDEWSYLIRRGLEHGPVIQIHRMASR
ncbi:hypothetical protein AVEN_12659-1 [Araneus ventricosus]|uniref:Uncharacterized protein n=1 Tax=Araneus ventricosus TaxID=182803 RepID=A0A4Y2AAU7_ARAVE|nr:hypothetical protein AVEN_12659-1 [Araneus ventricosus]